MGSWNITFKMLADDIESIIRFKMQRERLSYGEKVLVNNAINEAILDLFMDLGFNQDRFRETEVAVSTTVDQSFVDLPEDAFTVITETARIPSESIKLGIINEESLLIADPNLEQRGVPTLYGLSNSDTASRIRLILYPVPDQIYEIKLKCKQLPDANTVASLPNYIHAAFSDKAKENAMRNLGMFDSQVSFRQSYDDRMKKIKGTSGTDAPLAMKRVVAKPSVPQGDIYRRAGQWQ